MLAQASAASGPPPAQFLGGRGLLQAAIALGALGVPGASAENRAHTSEPKEIIVERSDLVESDFTLGGVNIESYLFLHEANEDAVIVGGGKNCWGRDCDKHKQKKKKGVVAKLAFCHENSLDWLRDLPETTNIHALAYDVTQGVDGLYALATQEDTTSILSLGKQEAELLSIGQADADAYALQVDAKGRPVAAISDRLSQQTEVTVFNILKSNSGEGVHTSKIDGFTMADNHMNTNSVLMSSEHKLFLAGSADSTGALASFDLSESVNSLVSFPDTQELLTVFSGLEENAVKALHGTFVSKTQEEGLWSLALNDKAEAIEGSATSTIIGSQATIASVMPDQARNVVHLVLTSGADYASYVVYDLENQRVEQALPFTAPSSPIAALLKLRDQAAGEPIFMTADSALYSIPEAEEELGDEETEVNFDEILDEMHIAFMQSEALRFESSVQTDVIEPTIDAESFNYEEGSDAEDDRFGFDGDHESNDFSSNGGSESSVLGDVRVFQSDDEEDEEDEEDDEKRVEKQRRRLDPSPPSPTSTESELSFCGDSSNDTSTDGTGQKCPRNIGWNDQNNGKGNGKGGYGNGGKDWDCSKNKLKICNRHYTITDDEYTFCFRDIRKFNCIYEYEITNIDPALESDLYDFDPATQTFVVYWDADLIPAGICFTDYTITIKATAAFDGAELFEDFILRIKNPCCDDDFREITQNFDMPATYDYQIGGGDANTPQGLEFGLIEPLIINLPNAATAAAQDLCNAETTYSAIFTGDDTLVDDTSEPITVVEEDFETFLLRIYDDSDDFLGTNYLFSNAFTPYYPVLSLAPTLPLATPLSTDPADYVNDPFNELTIINFLAPCPSNVRLNANPSQSDIEGTYEEDLLFTLSRLKTVPRGACAIRVECESVEYEDPGVTTSFTCDSFDVIDFYTDDNDAMGTMQINVPSAAYLSQTFPPGDYEVTLRVTIIGLPSETDTTSYTLTLLDPCDPPNSLEVETADLIADFDYKLYDPAATVSQANVWTIDPAYCPFSTSQSIGAITDAVGDGVSRAPISYDSGTETWTVLWATDLALVTRTQTVTYSAESISIYGSNTINDSEDFTVTYTDPCPDGTYTFSTFPTAPYIYIMTNPTATQIPYPTITADPAPCVASVEMTLSSQTQVIESNGYPSPGVMTIRDNDATSFIEELRDVASIDVTISFVVRTGISTSQSVISNSQTGTLTLQSPCLLSRNVVNVMRSIPQVYGKKGADFIYDFTDFSEIQTSGYTQALTFCGDLVYSAATVNAEATVGLTVSIPDQTLSQVYFQVDSGTPPSNDDMIFYTLTATWTQATFQSYSVVPTPNLTIKANLYEAQNRCNDPQDSPPFTVNCIIEDPVFALPPPETSQPFVADANNEGEITIGFTDPPGGGRRRQLSNLEYYESIFTEDFMDIRASSKMSDIESVPVEWRLKDFDGDMATVQMDLVDLQQKADLVEINSISITFKDSDGKLYGASGKKLANGQKLEFEIPPLVEKTQSKSSEAIADLWLSLIWVSLAITFLLAIFQGSLVTTWIFVNSLQLIAHVPLISARLPPNAHYFLLNFLGLTRLNFQAFNEAVDSMDAKLHEFQMVKDADSAFGTHLQNSGYHFSMVRNMLFGMVLFSLIGLVWGFTALFKRCNRSQQAQQAQANKTSKEVWMNNFMVRFLLLAFFELLICSFIQLSDLNGPGGAFWWFIALVFVVASCAAIVGVAMLLFMNGPYVTSYQPDSLLASFWGIRELAPGLFESEKKPVTNKQIALDELYSVGTPSNDAPTVTNSGVPLNQQMGAAVQLNEGGSDLATDRGCPTDRAMISNKSEEGQTSMTEEEALAMRMKSEAQLRLQLEDLVKVNGRYATLFSGLKVNTAHNSAVVEVLLFMVRRLIFAAAIVYMGQSPQVAMALMMGVTLFSLVFTVAEQPWKDPVANKLSIANEVFFYVVLVLALSCSSLTTADSSDEEILGYVIMFVVTAAIHVNLIVMISEAYGHVKLLYKRRENVKQLEVKMIAERLAKQAKSDIVTPQTNKVEEEEKDADSRQDPSLIMPQVDADTFEGEIDLTEGRKKRPQSHKQNDVLVELEKLSVVDEDFLGEQRLATPEAGMMRGAMRNTEESILAAVDGFKATPSIQPVSSLKFSKDEPEQSAFQVHEPVELGSSINGSKLASEEVSERGCPKLDEPIDSFEQVDDLVDLSNASDHANRKPVVESKEKNLKNYVETLAVNESLEGKSIQIPKESSFEYVPTMNGQPLRDQIKIQQQWADVMKDDHK